MDKTIQNYENSVHNNLRHKKEKIVSVMVFMLTGHFEGKHFKSLYLLLKVKIKGVK